jgi:ABC-2 type transport system permease protein
MISANLSLADRVRNHKKYIARTLWISVVAFLFMATYYILGVIMMVSRSINYGKIYGQTPDVIHYEKLNAVTKIMGFEQFGFLIIIFTAVAFAFQGFSYVFDQRKIDFYLSQPTTRAERIRKNYFNAFSTFILMYLVIELIAIIAAVIFGAVNSYVLISILLETVRSIVLFFAIYNIAVLAIMLSGTLPIAALVLFFFLGISFVLGLELQLYRESFFATYSSFSGYGIILSPVYDRVVSLDNLLMMARYDDHNMSMDAVKEILKSIWPKDLDILICGVVSFVLVLLLSRYRKAEHAGKTIVFRPFRWLMKIASCVVVGLAAGYFVQIIYVNLWNTGMYFLMFAVMVLATFVFGCILEAILEGNIRKLLCGKMQSIMAVCIVTLVFVIFRGDLVGYDSYIPKKADIESCAILDDDYSFQFYKNNTDLFNNSCEDNMYITDIDRFLELSEIGMKSRKDEFILSKEGHYVSDRMDVSILYRLKNGKKVYRMIAIPDDIDKKLLTSIIDSEEYKKGYFNIFNDEPLRELYKSTKSAQISYSTVTDYLTSKDIPYEEISDAYRKDVLAYYNYEMAEKTVPIGRIEVNFNDFSTYASCDMIVFDNYVNTISILKKYGIYSEGEHDVQYIVSVDVTNYYSGYNPPEGEEGAVPDDGTDYPSVTVTYTDPDEISRILSCSHSNDYYSRWYNSSKYENGQYVIEVTTSNRRSSFLVFEMGKVPDFVVADTN